MYSAITETGPDPAPSLIESTSMVLATLHLSKRHRSGKSRGFQPLSCEAGGQAVSHGETVRSCHHIAAKSDSWGQREPCLRNVFDIISCFQGWFAFQSRSCCKTLDKETVLGEVALFPIAMVDQWRQLLFQQCVRTIHQAWFSGINTMWRILFNLCVP